MRLPARLLHRKPAAHKGDFGHIFILAGCAQFSGAAVLCSAATMRSGAGLVTLGIPRGLINSIIKIKPPEVMLKPLPQSRELTLGLGAYSQVATFFKKSDILVVGPGISQNKASSGLIRRLIRIVDKPIVLDADGINALCKHLSLIKNNKLATFVLTPHPGEMSRLLGVSTAQVQFNRKKVAACFAQDYRVTVVLKGDHTVVAEPGGRIYVNKTGNPGMATAGAGDVLSGMIAAFLAQGLGAFEAAKYAVYLHGVAGDLAAKQVTQISLIASDIIKNIPMAIKRSK